MSRPGTKEVPQIAISKQAGGSQRRESLLFLLLIMVETIREIWGRPGVDCDEINDREAKHYACRSVPSGVD